MPKMSWKGSGTEVIYGFLRQVEKHMNDFGTEEVAFCFDHEVCFRKKLFPDYKSGRLRKRTPEEDEQRRELYEQIQSLRYALMEIAMLPNVFHCKGMEADDLLAKIADRWRGKSRGVDVVLVSSDKDLYQCLGENVIICRPGIGVVNWKNIRNEYGVSPHSWVKVKALCGCKSDSVPGIQGVGEITALRYLRGELPKHSICQKRIQSRDGMETYRRNLSLVRLPGEGCPDLHFTFGAFNLGRWKSLQRQFGIRV